MRLVNGGIQTKNFNSASINPTSTDTENDNADLNVIDIYGNVLARFEDGGVQTKKFRGYDYKTYVSPTAIYNGSALTLTVSKTFSRGDRIVLHCERGAAPWDYGAIVSYYEGQTPIKTNWRADCAWLEYTVHGNNVQISAVYAANATGMPNGNVRFEVSLLGDLPIKPTVVTVKQDGSGDYTTLRGALDAIGTKANDVLNPYRIEIYPGTYNVMNDYTDDEIATATYNQTSFVGPKLLNGISLIGMGYANQVIISGMLDTTKWTSSLRQVVSTLNFQGSVSIENLTIAAENLRYCIHDDFHSPMGKLRHVEMKNIIFKATGSMSYSIPVTYGASTRESGAYLYAENCDFGFSFGMHTDSVAHNDSCMYLKNCKAIQGSLYDQITDSSYTGKIVVHLDCCDFAQFSLGAATGVTPHTVLTGTLINSPMYGIRPTALYDTSDVVHCKKLSLSAGTAVEKYVYTSDNQTLYWRKATQVDKVGGIIVFNDDDTTYVQYKGYIRTDRLGLSGMTLGDWIGIDSDGASQIVQNEIDAWGRIAMMNADGTLGYVKIKGGV